MSFSIADGLKRTVNVIYWIWLALGVILFLYALINWGGILFAFLSGKSAGRKKEKLGGLKKANGTRTKDTMMLPYAVMLEKHIYELV